MVKASSERVALLIHHIDLQDLVNIDNIFSVCLGYDYERSENVWDVPEWLQLLWETASW